MDGNRFDRLTKTLAATVSRRAALGRLAGGGVGAALLTAGVAGEGAVAQAAGAAAATPAPGATPPCVVAFEAAVRQGPSAGLAMQGLLLLRAKPDGSVAGRLALLPMLGTPAAGAPAGTVEVVGQASGRAINLLLTLGDGRYLYGVGTMEHDLSQCAGTMGGPFVGPRAGDAGDWLIRPQPQLSPCQTDCRADFSRCSSSLSDEELNADINKCDLSLEGCLTGCSLNGR